ncbi:MAG: amino acid ABC transporter permease [Planctomycetes bacterium GWF2_42_9]|nr:MAG: amino acid ABC transporter permease [Planctomycetes bacterium GWF2_42_9]
MKVIIIIILSVEAVFATVQDSAVKVGSKKFTESVILGEIASQALSDGGVKTVHMRELGGTRILWSALLKGEIDVYPEYSGTIREEIFGGKLYSQMQLIDELAKHGISMTKSLGFNNTYAIGMNREKSLELSITKISDLANFKILKFGFSNEFMDRKDGWPGLRTRYNLPQVNVRGLDHDLAYRGLAAGTIDVIDLYATDAEIKYYNLTILEDDRHYFPEYDAVFLYRTDLAKQKPQAVRILVSLENRISAAYMIEMNAQAKLSRIPESQVASKALWQMFGIRDNVKAQSTASSIAQRTFEHLRLVIIALFAAILLAVPTGIVAAKVKQISKPVLGIAGIIQTIPSLALLVFLIPLFGIGALPAMIAIFLYSLLPIIRNTQVGLDDVPIGIRESAIALGLGTLPRLWLVELPMASGAILAGIKTSAVISVGTATLGAFIGAGGYGQSILTGIRLDNPGLIMQGAIPAAIMALGVEGLFGLVEKAVVPRGLRLKTAAQK